VTSTKSCRIRPYLEGDGDVVRRLIAELQDSLRGHDPWLPSGEAMSADYLEHTFEICRTHDGRILLAEVDGTIVGFATILLRFPFDSPDSPPGHFAYLMDLAVHAPYRGQGIGSLLMAAAEDAARAARVLEFRTLVLHGNPAVNLYRRAGMADYSLTLRKRLEDAAPK
jgi:ribosomal protein S18 acetylase RimI-like enzyme